ncbi:MAG: lipoyl synthase [Bacteroidales bacterium]|nr:lipoyl synthase [Bacteroidales bacterium]
MERKKYLRKPEWLKIKLPDAIEASRVVRMLDEKHLNTICTSGMCPNRGECWGAGTATFMICGAICTRNCKFCNVDHGRPLPLDPAEPDKIAQSVAHLKLKHAVLTSVDRDDLPDLGAAHWAASVKAIKELNPQVTIETLIPDFQGRTELIDQVIEAGPDVISHNLETVRRLTPAVRSAATYERSLKVLQHIAQSGTRAKTGIMLGLGETPEEVEQTIQDAVDAGVEVMTIGQYLQPTDENYPIQAYIHPDQFAEYARIGREKGLEHIESSPLVRSSYHAHLHVRKRTNEND